MTQKRKNILRTVVFVAVGMFLGVILHLVTLCDEGSCLIMGNPLYSALYMGAVGYLLSLVLKKEDGRCNT